MQLHRSGICVKHMLAYRTHVIVLIKVLNKSITSGFMEQAPGAVRMTFLVVYYSSCIQTYVSFHNINKNLIYGFHDMYKYVIKWLNKTNIILNIHVIQCK